MRRRCWLLVLWLSCGVPGAHGQQPTQPQWRYSQLEMTLSVAPEHGELRISGTGEVEITRPGQSDLQLRINGDWYTLKFESISLGGAKVETNITDASHKAWRIATAHFSTPLAEGAHIAIHFVVVKDRDSFPLAVKSNVAVAISEAAWYPTPVDGLAELPRGKMSFEMPLTWHAASMGTLVSERQQGETRIETFEAPGNRRRAFIAGPYKVHQSNSATGKNMLYLLDATVNQKSLLDAFDRGRQFLEARYGPLPFPEYRIAQMPDDAVPWYGSSEEGLIISRTEMMRSEEGLLSNLVHELAHSWWGNKVAPSGPGGPLLNEGMASFSGMAFSETAYGRQKTIEGSEFGSSTGSPDATLYGYMQIWRAGKDAAISQLKAGVGDHYNIAQSKGVWFLRMLSDRLGEERFDRALRQIVENDSVLTLSTFRKVMKDSAREDQGMEQFLSQWLDQTGIPVLDVRWRNERRGDRTHAVVSVFQGQSGAPYVLRLEIKLLTRKGVMVRAVEVQGVDTQLEFELPDELVGVVLDPDHKVLLWRSEYGAPPMSTH